MSSGVADLADLPRPVPQDGDGPAPPVAREGFAYRPHLDGLRAVAVYLVVAFHAGVARAGGGFIGVDVFFVLSGYLVTHILLRDLGTTGTVRFGRFYSRRVRRLLPAAVVNLVITALVFRSIGTPSEFAAAQDAIRWAAVYVSNWWFIREAADYFGADITASPVAHYWSLSVEEQFYLVWPLLLAGLHRLGRRVGRHHRRVLQVVVAIAGATSLLAALHISGTDVNRAYYGTDTRAYQLLAGAVLALTPGLVAVARRLPAGRVLLPGASMALLGALVVSATSKVHVGPIGRGILATAITCGLIVTLEASRGGIGRWILSLPPVTYLGRISYGTYLWHWIVILVALRKLEMAPLTTLAVTIPVATGLAALSYEILERPIRTARPLDRFRVATVAAGLVVSILIGFVVVPSLLDRPDASVEVVATDAGGTPVKAEWQNAFFDTFDYKTCPSGTKDPCTLVRGSGPTVLLAGDSHAAVLVPLFSDIARKHGYELKASFLPFCPWTLGVKYGGVGPNCFRDQANLFDHVVPTVDPDLLVLAHRSYDDPLNSTEVVDETAGNLGVRTARGAAAIDRRLVALFARPELADRKIVIVEPEPHSTKEGNPLKCLSGATYVEECRYVTSRTPTPEEKSLRRIDQARSNVWSLDLDRAVCPYLPICDPIVDGLVVKHDDNHLTLRFARSLDPLVERYLVDNGIIEG